MKNKHIQKNTNIQSVTAEIILIYKELKTLKNLRPSKRTNQLFTRLVHLCIKTSPGDADLVLKNKEVKKIVKNIRAICAEAEYEIEKYYSIKNITLFPYFKNYKKLSKIEEREFKGTNILFIGSGPLPLSAYLYSRRNWISVMDRSKEALKASKKFLYKNNIYLDHLESDAKKFNNYKKYSTIIVGALVGSTVEKKLIVKRILAQCGNTTRIIIRSVNGLGELLYPKFQDFNHPSIKKIKHVPVPKDVINPLIIIN